MRLEQVLTSYTLSSVAYHILQQRFDPSFPGSSGGLIKHYRVPSYSTATLSKWYDSSVPNHMVTLLRYMITRVSATLQILEESEVVTKTAYDSHPV